MIEAKVRVLMKKTIQPRMGKKLLSGEEYPVSKEIADRLVRQGAAEILPQGQTE